MESTKSTVYLNKRSQEILKRLGEQSGKSKSHLINEALRFYDESETHIGIVTATAAQATWEQRNIEVKRIVREVIKEDLVPLLSPTTS